MPAVTKASPNMSQRTRRRGLNLEGSWSAAGDLRLHNITLRQEGWRGPSVSPLPSWPTTGDAFQKELVAMDVCTEGPLEWSPGMLCRMPLSSSPSSQGSEAAEVNPSQIPLRLLVIMEWNVAVRHGWIESPLSKQDGSWDVTETTSHCSLQREISCVQVR